MLVKHMEGGLACLEKREHRLSSPVCRSLTPTQIIWVPSVPLHVENLVHSTLLLPNSWSLYEPCRPDGTGPRAGSGPQAINLISKSRTIGGNWEWGTTCFLTLFQSWIRF